MLRDRSFKIQKKHIICTTSTNIESTKYVTLLNLLVFSFLYIKKKSIIETIVEIIRGDKYDNVDNKSFFNIRSQA